MTPSQLTDPLTLPCGLTLPNRLARAAMTESLADRRNAPTPRHERLYRVTAAGGAGLVVTGNAMVDRAHLERAHNVVLDASTDADALRRWALSAQAAPTLVQLSHPGRQVARYVQPHPVAPSAGPALAIAGGVYAAPRGLTVAEVGQVRRRFVDAAVRVVDAGFPGVELHAAHGYLLSSFLDPQTNRRVDDYGGDLDGRARLLVEIVGDLRAARPAAAIAVKVDARDGAERELADLGLRLQDAGIDLIEVSGGTYERPAMAGFDEEGRELSTEHESPFWNAAAVLSAAVEVPVMLTGGFRTRAEVDRALAAGVCDLVGVGRPLAVRPSLAGRFVRGEIGELDRPAPRLGGPAVVRRPLAAAANAGWHRVQIARTAGGRRPLMRLPAFAAAIDYTAVDAVQAAITRRARLKLAAATPAPGAAPR